MTTPTRNPQKQQEREDLARLTREFLERGGEIEQVPVGVVTETVTITERHKKRMGK